MPKKTRRGHRLNWRRDLPDLRDARFANTLAGKAALDAPLPPSVDLREKCPPVVDQGQLGSCTANALAAALGFLELQEQAGAQTNAPEEFARPGFTPFSRLFIYWNERYMEGDTSQDGGAQIRDGIKTLAQTGACSELTWPYNPGAAFTAPASACYSEAAEHKISAYAALDNSNINELKAALASGVPFVFGFTVYDSFESENTANTGVMTMPAADDGCQGGHAVCCVGYDDSRQVFIVRNSWGTGWGDAGHFYMPYAYMVSEDLADDFWVVRR